MKPTFKVLCILLLFLCNTIQAQMDDKRKASIDSLLKVLTTQKEDTNKVKSLIALGKKYSFADAEKKIQYAKQAIVLSEKLNYPGGISNANYLIGNVYLRTSEFTKALDYFYEALKIEKEKGDKEAIGSLMNNIGNCYQGLGNYPKAIEALYDAVKCFEDNGNKYGQANCLNNIANIYIQRNDGEKAIESYGKAKAIYQNLDNKGGVALIEGNIADIYINRNELTKGYTYLQNSLTLYHEIGDSTGIERNLSNLGSLYLKQREYTKALENTFAAINIAEMNGYTDGLGFDYALLGEIYLAIGSDTTGNSSKPAGLNKGTALQLAKSYTDSSITTLLEIGDQASLVRSYKQLSDIKKIQNDFKSAYENYVLYHELSDSVFSLENEKKLTASSMNYEFSKKEDAIKAENEKKAIHQRNIRNTIAGGLAAALVFLIVVYNQRNKIAKEKKRSDELLLNILPAEVAEELKEKGSADAKLIDEVTVLFTDFKGFTKLSEKLSPKELVGEINECFSAFDHIMQKYGVEKIKTIGDSYMAAGGLPTSNKTHAVDVVNAAIAIQKYMQEHKTKKEAEGKLFFEIRIGVHSGPVVAGIVGVKKFAYDIWGDTVNTASRMESSGEAGKVNISRTTFEIVKDKFTCTHRGKISAKGIGELDMYFVDNNI